jgi:hypothetical protein
MPAQTRISASAMAEIDTSFKAYCSVVEKSDLALSSQSTYHDMTNNFLRWLRYEFEPGSRVAPYTPKKGKKDTAV